MSIREKFEAQAELLGMSIRQDMLGKDDTSTTNLFNIYKVAYAECIKDAVEACDAVIDAYYDPRYHQLKRLGAVECKREIEKLGGNHE